MNEMNYNEIASLIVDLLPEEWSKVAFFAQYFDDSYLMKFYADCGDGKYTDCYLLPDVSDDDIYNTFSAINKLIKPVYSSLDKKDKWSVMTILFSCDGNFRTEYEYKDISETSIAYIMEWKKKYLI